ncbi:MAG: tryptophan synthase subunit alpha [Fidelibacterota bacterium]
MSQKLIRLLERYKKQHRKCLSLFVTAGFPERDATVDIICQAADEGVDFIELGVPFSDPVADGPVIQRASQRALTNGIGLQDVLEMVKDIRRNTEIPIILMGYLNPFHVMGMEAFLTRAKTAGVDGLIIPDWPLEESLSCQAQLQAADLDLIHLIAPNTPPARIHTIDSVTSAFIYCVAYTGVTGQDNRPTPETIQFFDNLNRTLTHPWLIGFGIKDRQDFQLYTQYSDGVIIGSAFIRLLEQTAPDTRKSAIRTFIRNLR